MANILFYENMFSLGGTTRSLLDYAIYNEKILKNKSFLAFDKKIDSNFESHWSIQNFKERVDEAFNSVQNSFQTKIGLSYSDLDEYIKENNIEYVYQQKSGEVGGFMSSNAKNLIHAVFPQHPNNAHGNRYAFISEWLSEHCSNKSIPFVPYIVKKPNFDIDALGKEFRKKHDIPENAKVFGRLGGYNEFNIDFVQEAIKNTLSKDNNIYFMFCNTKGFIEHPRVFYFYAVSDLKEKYSFIGACDAMIHARKRGETFGLAIAEYSSCNKPVFTWKSSEERAHLEILKDKAVLYNSQEELENLLIDYKILENFDYDAYKNFSPENVIKKFESVFLK